mmetsp:Transcript_26741/g.43895  ORF Transcript_26741/g.43895 Transcript_26741/m.43895 type:complete len:110 (-) Transcript_26741:2350-2679(-)
MAQHVTASLPPDASPTKRQCHGKSSTPSRLVVDAGKDNNHKAASTLTKKDSEGKVNAVSSATTTTNKIVGMAGLAAERLNGEVSWSSSVLCRAVKAIGISGVSHRHFYR